MEHTRKLCSYTNISYLVLLFYGMLSDVKGEIITESKKNCACVPYYQCSDDFGDLITDGMGLLDVRVLKNNSCNGYLDVCCNLTKATLSRTTEAPQKLQGCGYQNPGSSPWYAALFFQEARDTSPSYKCGASLIHPKVVLTAAHCINGDGIWSVRMGNIFRVVTKIIIHPIYNEAVLQNDIALVILEESIGLSDKINTICIPSLGVSLENTRCRITVTVKGNEDKGLYFKMVKVPIMPKEKCLKRLRSTRLGPFFQLHTSFLCAGGNQERNTCAGDGGSALICPIPGQPRRYHQAGIVSWGIGCGDNDIPDVYVKVSVFRHWIDAEMMNNGLDITTYRN